MSSYPAGVRDGELIRFDGWDIPGYDVGHYFQNLSDGDRINKLREYSGEYGARFFAFTNSGWAKYWDVIDPSKFVKATGSTLYIRVEYSGWSFYPQKDSSGNDIGNVGVLSPPAIIGAINARADPSGVVGFRTNGFIKSKVAFPLDDLANSALFEGIYLRWGAQS